jgi:cellulose synthase/poly-beta-1,6-N-acetylglucosamine synthase-like glycosyltransferase
MDHTEAELRLNSSVSGLADRVPHVSARRLLTASQRILLALCAALIVGCAIVSAVTTFLVLGAIVTLTYVICVTYRVYLFLRSTGVDGSEVVTDAEARSIPDAEIPSYTVLIPVFREAEVIEHLVASIGRLEYPLDRLEVLILAEADDYETIEAIREQDPGAHFQLVLVPPAEPRTKPKALNFGLTLAQGQLLAVYDAEDDPDPLQLRRAVVAMRRLGPEVGCLQAKLTYDNPEQNLITRWFTLEYAMWFTFFLPGLASMGAPIPLGGTSNHFRRGVLRALGGWDPYNVTEDADLGVRMYREGYRVRVLESNTLEEANSDFVNWVKQRSRWYKGYLQTFLVHMRSPAQFRREMGWRGTAHFCIFVGGTPFIALLNPAFWVMAVVWFVAHPHFLQQIFPGPLYYLGLICWALGNFLLAYLTILSCRITRRRDLLWAALMVPLYWVMMSLASVKAYWQLAGSPTFWEKTSHGLRGQTRVEEVAS